MLISTKNKFIFIHNYKAAGSSIRRALEPHCLSKKQNIAVKKLIEKPFSKYLKQSHTNFVIKTFINSIPDSLTENYLKKILPLIPHHANAKDVKRAIPDELYNDYFKFGFVRNPWDWQVSLYFFIKQNKDHFQHEIVKNFNSFDEYIEAGLYKRNRRQKNFFTDKKGDLIVDFIGKFENIDEDMQKVLNAVNLQDQVVLPHTNKSSHRDYMSYYNKHTYKLIEENFKEDIEMFGYS